MPFLCVCVFFFLRFCPEPQLLCCGFLRCLCCTINQSISQLCEPNTSLWSALWHSVKEMKKLEAKGSSAHDPLFACLFSLQHTICRVHSVKARATAIKKDDRLSEKELKICRVEGLSLCHSTVLFSSSRPLHCLLLLLFCYYLSSSATKEIRFSFFYFFAYGKPIENTHFFFANTELFFLISRSWGSFNQKKTS